MAASATENQERPGVASSNLRIAASYALLWPLHVYLMAPLGVAVNPQQRRPKRISGG